jgi:phosphotransferase system HPr (HPr) family protein
MERIEIIVADRVGLHARPASIFVKTAKQFEAAIVVRHGERQANAKSIVQVLSLAARQGAQITLEAEGTDAAAALAALKQLVEAQHEVSA